MLGGGRHGRRAQDALLHPEEDPTTGEVINAHFGDSGYPLPNRGFDSTSAVWVGILAIVANLDVAVLVTLALRALRVSDGVDATRRADYLTEAGEPGVTVVAP